MFVRTFFLCIYKPVLIYFPLNFICLFSKLSEKKERPGTGEIYLEVYAFHLPVV